MWVYNVSTGKLSHEGETIGTGYSGNNTGLNNPEMESEEGVGPIPRGSYRICPFYHDPHKGPLTCHLVPNIGTNMYGRSGFLIHGDNVKLNESASHGCIVINRTARLLVATSGDNQLEVV